MDGHTDTQADSTIIPKTFVFAGVMVNRRDAVQHKSEQSTELRS